MRTQITRVMTLAATSVLFAACGEAPTATTGDLPSPTFAKPAKPTDNVMLDVVLGDPLTDSVTSDGGGQYLGYFRENGSFISSAYNQEREYCFNFPTDADLEPDEVLPASDCYPGYISTGAPGYLGATAIYPEPDPAGRTSGVVYWVTSEPAFPKAIETQWFLYFGTDCSLNEEPDRRFVVAHPSADTWTLGAPVPVGEDLPPILCRSPRKGEKGLQKVGVVYMPFELTMTLAGP